VPPIETTASIALNVIRGRRNTPMSKLAVSPRCGDWEELYWSLLVSATVSR
jgi:hypothetical protein